MTRIEQQLIDEKFDIYYDVESWHEEIEELIKDVDVQFLQSCMKDWMEDSQNSLQKSEDLNKMFMEELQNYMTSKNTVDIGGFYFQIDASYEDNKEEG